MDVLGGKCSVRRLLCLVLVLAGLAAGQLGSGCRRASDRAEGLTLSRLKNCRYRIGNDTVRLQDGVLTIGVPSGGYFYAGLADAALGDLDEDGKTDAAVILKTSKGGSAMSYELTAMIAGGSGVDGENFRQADTISLGERIEILTLLVLHGDIVLEMRGRWPGEGDGKSIVRVRRTYVLRGGELVETGADAE